MRDHKTLLQEYIHDHILEYRKANSLSQDKIAAVLRISSRSYFDQEHGEYSFSALTVMFYLMELKDEMIVGFVRGFQNRVEEEEQKAKEAFSLVYMSGV